MKIYDLENHYYNDEVLEVLSKRKTVPYCSKNKEKIYLRGTIFCPLGNPSYFDNYKNTYESITDISKKRLDNLDACGVTNAIISTGNGVEDGLSKKDAVRCARATNDAVYKMMQKYPDRYLGAITLPIPYVDECLKELKRCWDLGFVYWHTHSNYLSKHLYDKKFESIIALCNELGCPIYIHPNNPNDADMLTMGFIYNAAGLGFGVDTMKTSLRLIIQGVLDKYSNLTIILGHLGEFYPYILDRLDNRFTAAKLFDKQIKNKHDISWYFKNKRILVTTSGMESKASFVCAKETIGIDSILFGSDYPYEKMSDMVNAVINAGFTKEEQEKIFYKNAEKYILRKHK